MLQINIVTQLVVFFVFAITLNLLTLNVLFLVFIVLLLALACVRNHAFYRLSKRLKWFYLVMLLIYALNTPGEHVAALPITYEGLRAGLAQLLRIWLMLAALSILLANNTRQRLISGFYYLLLPLTHLKLDVERFAARLWLTLHYVDAQQNTPKHTQKLRNLSQSLTEAFNDKACDDVEIVLENPQFTYIDYAFILLMLGALVQMAWVAV